MIAPARTGLLVLLLLSSTTPFASGQETETEAEKEATTKLPDPRDPASVGFAYDPRELHPPGSENHPAWQRILGPVGIGGFHVFPGRITGENSGPPRTIWGHGFGTSLWRNPITGWPLQ